MYYNVTLYKLFIPVCTLSPSFSSDIFTDFPFSRLTLALDGKHSHGAQEQRGPLP